MNKVIFLVMSLFPVDTTNTLVADLQPINAKEHIYTNVFN